MEKKFQKSKFNLKVKIFVMSEQLRIILIIIVSVSIFGLLLFIFVKNYIRNKIDYLVRKEKEKKLK